MSTPKRVFGPALMTSFVALACAPAVAQDLGQTGSGGSVDLGEIVLEGNDGVKTEGTGSFATEFATVGGRQPVNLRDVPQSVTVITDERLTDAGARTLEDAAYAIPNLNVALGDPFTGSLYSRGYEVFTYNVDGAPRPYLSLYGTAPDLVFFDRVELLSGPSGVYQGSGEAVGTINLVRKRPTTEPQGRAFLSYGSHNSTRGEFDYSDALNESGTVRGRFIAYGDSQESFVDEVENDRMGVSGTIDIDVTDAVTLSFGVIAEEQDALRFSGLPSFDDGTLLDVDSDTFIGADWNNFESDSLDVFAEAQIALDNGAVVQLTTRRFDRDVSIKSLLSGSAVDSATGDFSVLTFAREYEETIDFVDLNLTSPFQLGRFGGEVTVGADYRKTRSTTLQNFDFTNGDQNIDTFDASALIEPDLDFPGVGPGFRLNTDTETEEYGLYVQGRVDLSSRARLSLGSRYIAYDSDTDDTGRGLDVSSPSENRFVFNIGYSYDLTEQVTAFVGYSDIFQPQAQQRADGARLNPVIGRQVEAGLKGSFNGGRLVAQSSLFYIRDKNRAIEDPANPASFLQGSEADTKGFELIVNGELSPNWSISGGYVYVDTDREEDPTSPHNLSLWGRYTFDDGMFAGMDAGLGVRAASDFSSTVDGVKLSAPGYAVFDAMVRYPLSARTTVQLQAENLFDKTYYTRVNQASRGNFYGEPRTFSIALNTEF